MQSKQTKSKPTLAKGMISAAISSNNHNDHHNNQSNDQYKWNQNKPKKKGGFIFFVFNY